MGPWIILLVYDFALYIFRSIHYEMPVVGGRARGRQRPRALNLAERPNGRIRGWSLGAHASGIENSDASADKGRRRRGGRGRGHRKKKNGEVEVEGRESTSGRGSRGSLTKSQELARDGEGEDECGKEKSPVIVEED
jgi:hypothetical protein